MGQSGESEVKVVFNLGVLEAWGLREGGPNAGKVGKKGLTQVR